MNVISLAASARKPGQSIARALRRTGQVPCILYGRHQDAVPFSTSEKSLNPLIHTSRTHLVHVSLDEAAWECIVKDIAFHPVTDRPMHADFQVLHAGEHVTLPVPIRYVGTSAGQAQGGLVRYAINELTVSCLPKHIPAQIDIEVSHVEIGDAIHVRDLQIPNVKFLAPADQILMAVERPRVLVEVGEEEEEDTEELVPDA